MNLDPDPLPDNNAFIITSVILLFVLLILSAFFSMSETAVTSYNKIRMENMAKHSRSARLVMKLSSNYDRLLSTILIGNNIVNVASASIATVLFSKFYNDMGPTIATIVVTVVVLIFGEVSPKSIAKEKPEAIAKFCSYLLAFFYIIFFPISLLLSGISYLIKLPFKKKDEPTPVYTEEEFNMLVEDIQEDGVITELEQDIIQNTIKYGDTRVEDVMVPKKQVAFVKDTDSFDKIAKKFISSSKSRLIVTKTDSIATAYGFIHQKDFFEFMYKKNTDLKRIIIDDIVVTKSTNKISRLLKQFQAKHQHIAIVKNKKDHIVGIVTMEDIIEELLGDIKDEAED